MYSYVGTVEACDADERKRNAYEIKNLTVTCHLVSVYAVILSKCSLLERVICGLEHELSAIIIMPTQSIKSPVNNKSEIV